MKYPAIGISPYLRRGGGDTITTAWIARVQSEGGSVTEGEAEAISTFVSSIPIGEFDRLWVHGLQNEIAARTSIANAATADLITNVNLTTFTAGEGFTGNGSSMYLNTNFNAAVDGVKFTRNSSSYGGYFTLNIDEAKVEIGASDSGGAGADGVFLEVQRGGLIYANCNGTFATQAVSDARGLTAISRDNAANFNIVKNGTTTNHVSASAALVNKDIYILNWNEVVPGFLSSQRVALTFFGSGAINQATFYTAVQNLATALGFNV